MKIPFVKLKEEKLNPEVDVTSTTVGSFCRVSKTPEAHKQYHGALACRFSENTIGIWRVYQHPDSANITEAILIFNAVPADQLGGYRFKYCEQIALG